MAEKRHYFMKNLDDIRKVLITEPRGYPCQNLNIIVPPCDPRAEAGKNKKELNLCANYIC